MTGREFFDKSGGALNCCELMQANPTMCEAWEKSSVSVYSPGPVKDEETLYRQILNPVHVEAGAAELKPTAFNDVSDKGLSVNRDCEGKNKEALVQAGIERAKATSIAEKVRTFVALARFCCHRVRAITDDAGQRGFLVLDTAIKEDPSHADICQIAPGKQARRSLRGKLFCSIEEIEWQAGWPQATS